MGNHRNHRRKQFVVGISEGYFDSHPDFPLRDSYYVMTVLAYSRREAVTVAWHIYCGKLSPKINKRVKRVFLAVFNKETHSFDTEFMAFTVLGPRIKK